MIFNKLKTIFKKPNSDLGKTIEQIDFTVRTYNILKRQGIDTVGDLTQLSWNDLSRMRGMYRRGIEEAEKVLEGMGLGLRKE